MEMGYSIDRVARLVGVPAFTLRNWEKRYGLLKPRRLENGFRVYAEEDIALLKRIGVLLSQGARIGELVTLIQSGRQLPDPLPQGDGDELTRGVNDIFEALKRFDTEKLDRLFALMSSRYSAARMLEFLYQPLFSRLGSEWETGLISIAQEHFASACIRMRLAPMLSLAVAPRKDAIKVVCATLQGERHEGGLLLLASQMKLRGWDVIYLGTDLPISELPAVIKSTSPDLICLSFATLKVNSPHIEFLKSLKTTICLGGRAARESVDEENLPSHLHLFRVGGAEAVELLEMLAMSQR